MERTLARGDVIIVTLQGEYGKTRPAVIIQSRALSDIPSVVIVPCTSELIDECIYRPNLPVGDETGLKLASQAMVDKITAISLRRVKAHVGSVPSANLRLLTQAAQFVIGAFDDL